jgi:hypothetical protein
VCRGGRTADRRLSPVPTRPRDYPLTPDTRTPQSRWRTASPAKPARQRPAGRAGDPDRPAMYPGGTWHPPPVDLRRHRASPATTPTHPILRDCALQSICPGDASFGTRNARDSGKVIPGGRADSVRRILTCAASWGEDGRSSWLTPAIVVRSTQGRTRRVYSAVNPPSTVRVVPVT